MGGRTRRGCARTLTYLGAPLAIPRTHVASGVVETMSGYALVSNRQSEI